MYAGGPFHRQDLYRLKSSAFSFDLKEILTSDLYQRLHMTGNQPCRCVQNVWAIWLLEKELQRNKILVKFDLCVTYRLWSAS